MRRARSNFGRNLLILNIIPSLLWLWRGDISIQTYVYIRYEIKVIFLFIFVLYPVLSFSQNINAFQDGTQWIEEESYFYDGDTTVTTYSIDGEIVIGDRSCFNLYRSDNGGGKWLYMYLYTEGEKVYAIPTDNTSVSLLLYDFGIAANDTVQICNMQMYKTWGPSV